MPGSFVQRSTPPVILPGADADEGGGGANHKRWPERKVSFLGHGCQKQKKAEAKLENPKSSR
ncbi:hypothetical protein KCP71_12100 [Salmonella enterica subsp. enterica]|nr:hypothetical protein KCP71_12100 [Salmonella enterica subsp. enterica]